MALAESTVLCAAGAVVGWLVYAWARPLFASVLPAGLQAFATETVDVRVIALAGILALVSAIAGGMLPAIRTSRMAPLDVMRPSRDAFGRIDGAPVLLGVQAALGVILLTGALAVLPGVLRTLLAPPGFDARDLYVTHFHTAYDDESASDAREMTRRGMVGLEIVRELPGVVGATLLMGDPFGPPTGLEHSIETGRLPNFSGFDGLIRAVDADFFRTLAVPLRAGRAFSHADVEQQALVAILNESGVRTLWPGVLVESAIGRTVTSRDGPRVVIGVAPDFRIGIDQPTRSTLFLPLSAHQAYTSTTAGFVRTHNAYQVVVRMAPGRIPDTVLMSDRLREQPWTLPDWVGRTMPESVAFDLNRALETPRLLALIFTTLAATALILTLVAMYGLASFEIRHRREEMTVRLALGASPRALRRRLAVVIARPVAIGVLLGLPFGWVQVRLIGLSLPFIDAGDPQIYVVAGAAVVVAALVAAWLPGRRFFTMRVAELLRSS
jgi:ABC-type antimicrobial peptide transport system permease subunit